jgi:two-component system cell cycle response regulator
MDLDHFKRVNDSFGHDVGDQVLRAFAGRVRSATRRADVLVRRGGEEFVLVMPAATAEQAEDIAERVRENVARTPFAIGERRIAQTVSIGVATWTVRESADALEKRADEAMYRAKELGRDRVVFAKAKQAAAKADPPKRVAPKRPARVTKRPARRAGRRS